MTQRACHQSLVDLLAMARIMRTEMPLKRIKSQRDLTQRDCREDDAFLRCNDDLHRWMLESERVEGIQEPRRGLIVVEHVTGFSAKSVTHSRHSIEPSLSTNLATITSTESSNCWSSEFHWYLPGMWSYPATQGAVQSKNRARIFGSL